MNRRTFLGAAATAPLAGQRRAPGAPERPNVVLILADDLAAWMLGCYGNKEIRTPNIDLLARSGVRFVNNFVVTPICSASRATLFTGRVPRQHGIHDFLTANPIASPPQGQKEPRLRRLVTAAGTWASGTWATTRSPATDTSSRTRCRAEAVPIRTR